jgi:hypothetical protein
MMSWRPIRPAELEVCLNINPKGMGHEIVGRARALAAWKGLLKSRSFQSFAIESDEPIQGHRIVGFGASVFVSAAFLERETADPQPGLNARLISSITSGQAVVLSAKQVGYENAKGSLHLIVLQGGSMLEVLTPEQRQDILRQVGLAVFSCLDGYQIRRSLMETISATEIRHAKLFPIWKVRSTFEGFHRHNPGSSWNRDRALFAVDRAEGPAFVVPGGNRHEPVLRLRSSDQDLLAAALKGSTDSELAEELGLKLSTLKKRWAAVFNRVAIAKPDLLPGLDDNLDSQARGRQKRHRLLAYVREHPEELRPYLHSPISQKRPSSQPRSPSESAEI